MHKKGLMFGCMDSTACNYHEEAPYESGSCFYSSLGFDCDGNCLLDLNANGICDPDEIVGCDDSLAVNFNPLVNVVDLESCIYDTCQVVYGAGAYTSACGWCVGGEAPQNEESCHGVCMSPSSLQHMPSGGIEFAGIQGQIVSIDSAQTLMAMRLKLCPSQSHQVNLREAHESDWNDGAIVSSSAVGVGNITCTSEAMYEWVHVPLSSPVSLSAGDELVIEIAGGFALGEYPGGYAWSDAIWGGVLRAIWTCISTLFSAMARVVVQTNRHAILMALLILTMGLVCSLMP